MTVARISVLAGVLAVWAASIPSVQADDRKPEGVRTRAPAVVAPQEPAAPKRPIGTKGSMAGCCTPPGPDGLECCDTRDCGWFDCDDGTSLTGKKYKTKGP